MENKRQQPPRTARRIIELLSQRYHRHSALGDLEEMYHQIVADSGITPARRWYRRQAMKSVPFLVRNLIYWSMEMFLNYLKIALRNVRRNRINTVVNVFGLSIGIAFSLLIFLYITDEYSYDEFHEDADSTYLVWTYVDNPRYGISRMGATPIPLADDLKRLYPQVEHVVRISDTEALVRRPDYVFNEKLMFVDPGFFSVFSFPIIQGNRTNPLDDRQSVVISREAAEKYFPGENPIGRTLEISRRGKSIDFTVTAVVDNMKRSSSIPFDFLLNYDIYYDSASSFMKTNYNTHNPLTFIKLMPGTDTESLRSSLFNIDDHIDQKLLEGVVKEYRLENLRDIHLSRDFENSTMIMNNPVYSYILAGIGGIILLIACINFMTLSVGLSFKRTKEVGIRKVMGAYKLQLIKQFLGEAVLLSILAVTAGIVLAVCALPLFNGISGKDLVFHIDFRMLLLLPLLALTVGCISGFYPAVIQSGIEPVQIFRSRIKTGGKKLFGKILVVIQFSLSIFLIITTVVFHRQLHFISARNLGFEQERLVEISLNRITDDPVRQFELFRNEIINDNRIAGIAAASSFYGLSYGNGEVFWTRLGFKDGGGERKYIHYNRVSYDYVNTMGLEIVAGRDFSREFGSDAENAVIINEAAAKYLNLQDPLNKSIEDLAKPGQKIIGVVRDFHFASLHGEIKPLLLSLTDNSIDDDKLSGLYGFWPQNYNTVVLRISKSTSLQIIDDLKETWVRLFPDSPFEVKFVDETIQQFYESERKWGRIINYSAIFAVFIACLGLFGLSLIAAEQKIREIGIRKVLGAGTGRIVVHVSKHLLILVAAANIFSWPAAYYVAEVWLRDFAYRTDLTFSVFIASGLLACMIAAATISFHSIKTARSNPVDTLRYE